MSAQQDEAEESGKEGKRRNGSTLVGLIAAALLLVAFGYLAGLARGCWQLPSELSHVKPLKTELWIDAISCLVFSGVLFWWAASGPAGLGMFKKGRSWKIGNPTVSMVITTVAAVVAIVTFTHELMKP